MIALYSRVSTAEQAKEGYSVGEQEERLAAFCSSRGWKNFKHYTDAGFSGGNMKRPALQDMLEAIRAGRVKAVIVYKLDRLSRSQRDMLELIEDVFIPNGVDFISMSESFDTGSAFGMATIGMMSCFAQLERSQIKERMMIGHDARAKEGKWHGGGTTPIGYDYTDGRLAINDFEALQIRECFRLFIDGYTRTEILRKFNDNGWTHKHGKWYLSTIRRVLLNPLYIGFIRHGDQLIQGVHDPIVDKDTFERAAVMLKNRRRRTNKRRPISEAYLVGKIFCARCGHRYTHQRTVSGHKGSSKKISYYACMGRSYPVRYGMKKRCDNTIYRTDEVDSQLFDQLRGLQVEGLEDMKDSFSEEQDLDTAAILQKELAKIDKQRSRLIDLFSLGTFDAEELSEKVETLNKARAALEEQLEEAAAEKPSFFDMKDTVNSIGDIIDRGTPEQIRVLIDALIDHIDFDGDDMTIYWNFS